MRAVREGRGKDSGPQAATRLTPAADAPTNARRLTSILRLSNTPPDPATTGFLLSSPGRAYPGYRTPSRWAWQRLCIFGHATKLITAPGQGAAAAKLAQSNLQI